MIAIHISTSQREELRDVCAEVAEVAARCPTAAALLVMSPHTTAGVLINEGADPDVAQDVLSHLRHLVPPQTRFRHAEGNADAHIKTILVGSSIHVPVHNGRLQLGTWQRIFLAEFDGPRRRTLWIQPLCGIAPS